LGGGLGMVSLNFYMFIILLIPSTIFSIAMLILIHYNKVNYLSRKIRDIIVGIGMSIYLAASLIYLYLLLPYFIIFIVLQLIPPAILNFILFYKSVDKNGDYIVRN